MQTLRRNTGFWLLMTGQSISLFGDILYTVAVLSFTYAQTNSVLGTASIMILTTLTRLMAGFVTMQVADRVPHRRLMILADLVRACSVGVLGLFSLRWELSLPAIYSATVVTAFAGAFYTPARSSILPSLVEREELVRANGLIAAVAQTVQMVAWAGGAMVVAAAGTSAAILFNAASFLLSALATALIRPREMQPAAEAGGQGPLERLKAGWRLVWSNRVVRDVTIMDAIENFANVIWTSALLLAFTVEVLGAGPEWWGYQGSAFFVGTVIGGLVAAAASGWLARWGGWTIVASSASFALLTLWYTFAGSAPLAVALCVVFGPVYQLRDVMQSSMLQASLDPRMIARAFATREMLLMTLYGPAMAAMGLLADLGGPQAAYLTGAGLYALVALFAAGSVPIRTYSMAPVAARAD
ncbi:MAG: MFS transporter [Bacillota bacterium]